jgi:hypothetical protein
MTIPHLDSDYINPLALQLAEDVYGSNGDLNDEEIMERLMEAVFNHTESSSRETGVPLRTVASLIRSVWEYMDRKYMDQLAKTDSVTASYRVHGQRHV